MSNKQNDLYWERVQQAEQDLRDAREALDNAREERQKATQWEVDCTNRVMEYQVLLDKIKNNE